MTVKWLHKSDDFALNWQNPCTFGKLIHILSILGNVECSKCPFYIYLMYLSSIWNSNKDLKLTPAQCMQLERKTACNPWNSIGNFLAQELVPWILSGLPLESCLSFRIITDGKGRIPGGGVSSFDVPFLFRVSNSSWTPFNNSCLSGLTRVSCKEGLLLLVIVWGIAVALYFLCGCGRRLYAGVLLILSILVSSICVVSGSTFVIGIIHAFITPSLDRSVLWLVRRSRCRWVVSEHFLNCSWRQTF